MPPPQAVLRALVGCAALPGVVGEGESIFTLGDYIDHKPWELMAMFLTVFVITRLYEWAVEYVEHKSASSHVGAVVVHHMFSELMILGGISAILTVFENLGGTKYFEPALFHYVHFVIFLMAVFFIAMVAVSGYFGQASWRHWSRFEFKVLEIEADPSLSLDSKTAFLQHYVQRVPEGPRMLSCLIYFRQSLPKHLRKIGFARYCKKQHGQRLLEFMDLEWYTWLALSAVCLTIAVGTEVTFALSDKSIANVAGWVFFIGYGPAVLFLIVYFKIRRAYFEFTNTLMEHHAEDPTALCKLVLDQRQHFWFNSPRFLGAMMQALLLIQEFYLANCVANFTYRLTKYSSGWFFIVVSFLPPLVIFLGFLPEIMPRFVILSSLGTFLDVATLQRIIEHDESSGKYRRRELRDRVRLQRAAMYRNADHDLFHRFIDDDSEEEDSPPGSPRGAPRSPAHVKRADDEVCIATDEGLLPLRPLHDVHEHHTGHAPRGPDIICEECDVAPAGFACGECGYLCTRCTRKYHSLKRFATHKVFKLSHSLFETKQPLLTDNPVLNKDLTAAALYRKHGALEEVVGAIQLGCTVHPIVTEELRVESTLQPL
eukprot:TRINITY_DN22842_c0_g1_i1.p1 TRINITY_DN22842_c0_g1~~TRINITY_DN22842_c0_g1_i1.p1  ORF type:complete len:598 (+),score=173.69 TRINITY_DN22842_c0_g1_i1:56-1849(+)